MKPFLLYILAFISLTGAVFAADSGPTFLMTGRTYDLTYAVTDPGTFKRRLTTTVTIVSGGGGSWFLVKRNLGLEEQFWLNFALVAEVSLRPEPPAASK